MASLPGQGGGDPDIGGLQPVFSKWNWSPDGRLISGRLKGKDPGSGGVGVYDLSSRGGRLVTTEDIPFTAPWLPDGRRLIYFTPAHERVVLDVVTGERRVLAVDLAIPPGYEDEVFAVAREGTAIYHGAERADSSIWMVERERQMSPLVLKDRPGTRPPQSRRIHPG